MLTSDIDFSFIIPTLNSEKTLAFALKSIRNQNYPQDKIEIILVDGGSKDHTLEIGTKFDTIIVHNDKILPEAAKAIGLQRATGKYYVFHDSDEVLINTNSLLNRKSIFDIYSSVGSIATSGLVTPDNYPGWSDYTNIVGDPFSRFIYGGGGGDAWDSLPQMYSHEYECKNYLILKYMDSDIPPLFDACSHTIKRSCFEKLFSGRFSSVKIAQVIPSIIINSGYFAILKDDYVLHYSSSTPLQIFRKLRFRVINNCTSKPDTQAGFINRQNLIPPRFRIKKYLFVFYALSLVWPLYDGIALALKRRRLVFLFHPFFSMSLIILIFWYTIRSVFWQRDELSKYG